MRCLARGLQAVGLALLLCAGAAAAGEATSLAADPALEARVQRLAGELRCLVCQNQTVADSHAALAMDVKAQIREQLGAGRSEQEVLEYMVQRFGDFVLYRPPVKASTALLWAGPFVLLGLAGVGVLGFIRRQRVAALPDFDPEDWERAAAHVGGDTRDAA